MAIERHETYTFDDMYYVTGFEQTLHFQQLFKILELLGLSWASKCHHIPFGRIRGMSTRKGDSFLENPLLRFCCCASNSHLTRFLVIQAMSSCCKTS